MDDLRIPVDVDGVLFCGDEGGVFGFGFTGGGADGLVLLPLGRVAKGATLA